MCALEQRGIKGTHKEPKAGLCAPEPYKGPKASPCGPEPSQKGPAPGCVTQSPAEGPRAKGHAAQSCRRRTRSWAFDGLRPSRRICAQSQGPCGPEPSQKGPGPLCDAMDPYVNPLEQMLVMVCDDTTSHQVW